MLGDKNVMNDISGPKKFGSQNSFNMENIKFPNFCWYQENFWSQIVWVPKICVQKSQKIYFPNNDWVFPH